MKGNLSILEANILHGLSGLSLDARLCEEAEDVFLARLDKDGAGGAEQAAWAFAAVQSKIDAVLGAAARVDPRAEQAIANGLRAFMRKTLFDHHHPSTNGTRPFRT